MHDQPCRIGSVAGNVGCDVFWRNFLGFRLTSPARSDENLHMLSRVPTQTKPLTPLMLATLQHLASRGDQTLVRLYSGFWIAESDEKTNPLSRETRDFDGRFLASGGILDEYEQPLLVVRTTTVKAMVARGLLKLFGKKCATGGTGKRKDFSRAALTSQATALREELEDKSQAAYEDVLQRLH